MIKIHIVDNVAKLFLCFKFLVKRTAQWDRERETSKWAVDSKIKIITTKWFMCTRKYRCWLLFASLFNQPKRDGCAATSNSSELCKYLIFNKLLAWSQLTHANFSLSTTRNLFDDSRSSLAAILELNLNTRSEKICVKIHFKGSLRQELSYQIQKINDDWMPNGLIERDTKNEHKKVEKVLKWLFFPLKYFFHV